MAGQKLKSARTVAIEVLNNCDPERNYAGPILDKLLHETNQRQRATDLVFGTLRNHRAIDTVIAAFSGRPIERIQGKLLNIIRIGIYELIYSPSTGQHSIVNEAVENAKAAAGAKPAGFVNAVLREVTRHITNRQIRLSQSDAKRTLPQTPATGCEFDTGFLPDCETCPADYLSTVFSLPKWLITDWLGEFGEELTRQVCFASNRRPSIYIRPNSLRTTAKDLAEKLRQEGIDSEIIPSVTVAQAAVQKNTDAADSCFHSNDNLGQSMLKIKSPRAISQLPGFAEGLFTVQDITASQPVRLLNPRPDRTILDLCAAPGTKTTQLAEATGDLATIIATDIDNRRLKMVKENAARLGIKSIAIVAYEELKHSGGSRTAPTSGSFDAVLVDVPCSNTGVLAKRIEARYRISSKAIEGLTKIQGELLRTAAAMVKPNGKICYSTCSIQKYENSELVRRFLKESHAFELESETLALPSARGFDHDGGYTAILVKLKTQN